MTGVDPEVAMFKTFATAPRGVGTNGGTSARLVGDYDTVARRVVEFIDAGIETFLLQFQPFEPEMRVFAEQIMPRVADLRRWRSENAAGQGETQPETIVTPGPDA